MDENAWTRGLLPYAHQEYTDGQLIRVCPTCGERIPEATDEDGELTTNNYADHYAKAHP